MKMSGMFKGLNEYKMVIDSMLASPNFGKKTRGRKCKEEIEGIKVSGQFFNDLSPRQMMAIELAVNNHDALVGALKSITKKLNWNSNGSCDYCGNECPNHKDDCDYVSAVKLLDKIKDPLDE